MKYRFPYGFALLSILILLTGCSGEEEGPKKYPVSGTVKLDGTDLKTGEIQFFSEDGSHMDSGTITDGKFSFEATEGKKTVKITSQQEQGVAADGLPNNVNIVPAKYNTQTTLSETVQTDESKNQFEFILQSK